MRLLKVCCVFFVVAFSPAWSLNEAPFDPPFAGTIFLDPDIITSQDPTAFQSISYSGQGVRTMFDRRVNTWVQENAFLFEVVFDDGLTTEVQVNPEFGTPEDALTDATTYAIEVGRIPTALRRDMQTMWIHKGVEPFGGGNNNVLIHTGQAANYVAAGILEETLVHEASHTSLDAQHGNSAGWRAAQASDPEFISTYARDFPDREDIAESFLLYLAVHYRADRIDTQLQQTIQQTMPARLAYFDQLNLDMHPILNTATDIDEPETLPEEPLLGQNFPNPFSTSTEMKLSMSESAHVQVAVFDISGKAIVSLVDSVLTSGGHSIWWNGEDSTGSPVISGVYLFRMRSGDRLFVRKVVLLR